SSLKGCSLMFSSRSLFSILKSAIYIFRVVFLMWANGSPLAVGGDFEALHCQPAPNLDRSTNLQLTTSPPLAANGCYVMLYFNQVSFLFLSRRLTILFCFLFYCNS